MDGLQFNAREFPGVEIEASNWSARELEWLESVDYPRNRIIKNLRFGRNENFQIFIDREFNKK